MMEQSLKPARKFWTLFSALPGCDERSVVRHGVGAAVGAAVAPTTTRSKRPVRDVSPSPGDFAAAYFFNTTDDFLEDAGVEDGGAMEEEYNPPAEEQQAPKVPSKPSHAPRAAPKKEKKVVVHTGKPKAQRVSLKKSKQLAATKLIDLTAQDVQDYGKQKVVRCSHYLRLRPCQMSSARSIVPNYCSQDSSAFESHRCVIAGSCRHHWCSTEGSVAES